MNWLHVTERLAKEFRLPGCFVLNRENDEWVGKTPSSAFCGYLSSLFETKDTTYFKEVRFFKYNDATSKTDERKIRYLALMPINLEAVPYDFLGLLYENQDALQELLRFRIMPNYTLFWLYQLVAEARVRNAGGGQKALIKALDEQRLYARQLEGKLDALHNDIDVIRNSKLTLGEQVRRLNAVLDRQLAEYQELMDRYQELFDDHNRLQNDYLSTCVTLETRLSELETAEIQRELGVEELEGEKLSEAAEDKSGSRIKNLMERLGQSQQALLKLHGELEKTRSAYGDMSPDQVQQMVQTNVDLRRKMDYYKQRAENNERRVKKLKAQMMAARRGQT